jgi:SAM-dependent methyltransferase
LLDWEFSGLGDSVFNYTADFHACSACGLVYVSNISDVGLSRFYDEECGYFDKTHYAVTDPANQRKYAFYIRFLKEQGITSVETADVGCGRGGFATWLAESGWEKTCWGVDVDVRSLPDNSGPHRQVSFRQGSCLNLPFEDNTLGLLTYFHVLEHIRDLSGLLAEAARVLREDGHILIEVPDAEHYSSLPIGSGFWFSIREHINHFTAKSLVVALQAHGLAAFTISQQRLESPESDYPSLMVLARKNSASPSAVLSTSGEVSAFARLSQQALIRQAERISDLAAAQPLTLWGCSSEMFSFLPLLDICQARLCDSSKFKQQMHYRGLVVQDPAAVPVKGLLVVVPYRHKAAIKTAAQRLGWPENAIYCPE